jgi:hypothetical protein
MDTHRLINRLLEPASQSAGILTRQDVREGIEAELGRALSERAVDAILCDLLKAGALERLSSRGKFLMPIPGGIVEAVAGGEFNAALSVLRKLTEGLSVSEEGRMAYFGHTALRVLSLGNFMPSSVIHVAVSSASDGFALRTLWERFSERLGLGYTLETHLATESLRHVKHTSLGASVDPIRTAIDIANTEDLYEGTKILEQLIVEGRVSLDSEEDRKTVLRAYGDEAKPLLRALKDGGLPAKARRWPPP